MALILVFRKRITQKDPSVTGFDIWVNRGVSAGQDHHACTFNLTPRRDGDTQEPGGGVRGQEMLDTDRRKGKHASRRMSPGTK